jgi:hypothetical protein
MVHLTSPLFGSGTLCPYGAPDFTVVWSRNSIPLRCTWLHCCLEQELYARMVHLTSPLFGAGTLFPYSAPDFTLVWSRNSIPLRCTWLHPFLEQELYVLTVHLTSPLSWAGTLFPYGAPDFTLVLEWVSCCSILVFSVYYYVDHCLFVCFLLTIVLSVFFWPLYSLFSL